MKNEIYLRRKTKVLLKKGSGRLIPELLGTMLKNIESLGYTFSNKLIKRLITFTPTEAEGFFKETIKNLKAMLGAKVKYAPMYPNFPQQVMDASDDELYFNAIMHYFGDAIGERIMPEYKKEKREPLKDKIKLKKIDLGSNEDFESLIKGLMASKTSISETDKKDVTNVIKSYGDESKRLIPNEIPLKENVALLVSLLMDHTTIAEQYAPKILKTATDILRLAVALSDGDISLVENTRFKSFSKKERRVLLSALNSDKSATENMLRYKEQWKRLGERLHPFEYKNRFPNVIQPFKVIRNNLKFETFGGIVENLLANGYALTASKRLMKRPGEFARRLDHLLRTVNRPAAIVNEFAAIAENVSSPVLLQVMNHFLNRTNRTNESDVRVFFPKGNAGKLKAIKNNLPPIKDKWCVEIANVCQNRLIEKFKELSDLGKVYVDAELMQFNVPFGLRSASKALKTVGRGSRIQLPVGNTIRFFIWWKDGKERTDLDLTAPALSQRFEYMTDISYYNLTEEGWGHHSGDITSAPKGASEFIDIDKKKALSSGYGYIILSVYSYTEQPFNELPECFAGVMGRSKPNSGEIYDPRTVLNKFDLTANTKVCIPLIIDLVNNEMIWTDLGVTNQLQESNNAFNNRSTMSLVAESMVKMNKPTLYELFDLHATARGERVDTKKEADTIFSVDKGITPFDTEKIISEFL